MDSPGFREIRSINLKKNAIYVRDTVFFGLGPRIHSSKDIPDGILR